MLRTSEAREISVKTKPAIGKSSREGATTKAAEEATMLLRDYFSNQMNAKG